jgi:hypothetical protein
VGAILEKTLASSRIRNNACDNSGNDSEDGKTDHFVVGFG